MAGERQNLRLAGQDPIWRLWSQLPGPWRGPGHRRGRRRLEESITENDDYRINVTGLPEVIQAELAWTAHWQGADGTCCRSWHQPARNILRRGWRGASFLDLADGLEPRPRCRHGSTRTRWGVPPHGVRRGGVSGSRARRCRGCPTGWWELVTGSPRDQRFAVRPRTAAPTQGAITHAWLREAVSGIWARCWSPARALDHRQRGKTPVPDRFDRWLAWAFAYGLALAAGGRRVAAV